jgi:hypothetical protein
MVRKLIQLAVPFIWFGAVAAISFIEAPLKFQAPGITIPLGLGIGRLVFFALNKAEIVFAAIFILSLIGAATIGRLASILFACVAGILLLETVWLLPVLDARAELVINGAEPFSRLHLVYIACDATKLVLLFWLGTVVARWHLSDR